MKSNIDQCIKCSICNVYCPVLQTTGLFPGPKLSGPDAERFRLQRKAIPSDWLAFCDYCKICEMVCPHNVPIPELHVRSRIAWGKKRRPSSREWLLGHSYLLERLGSWTAPFSNWLVGWAFFRWLLDRGLGIDRRTKIPFFRRQTFERWFRSRPFMSGKPIAYFYGCYTNYIDPALGQDVVEVLEKNGFRVTLPAQECCGLPLIGNGFFDLAARLGEKNLKSLRKSVDETYYYHVPCHLRALQVGLPALELLYLIPGLKIIELPEGCCGLAGTYGFKRDKYAVAREIGEEIFQAIRKLDARRVISDCEACRMQIAHQTGVKTFHTIQILRQAYGE